MGLLLLVVLVILLLGALPAYPYSRGWGYAPTGVLGLLLVGAVVLLLIGSIPWGFGQPVYVARPVTVVNPPPVTVVNPPARVVPPGTPPQ